MRVTKLVVAVLGLIVAALAGYFLFTAWVDIRGLMMVANANRSAEFPSPWRRVWWAAGLALLGGLILGLAIGLPLSLHRDRVVEHGVRRERGRVGRGARADETNDEVIDENHVAN